MTPDLSIPFEENNLCDALAAVGLLGILERRKLATAAWWLPQRLALATSASDQELTEAVHVFLSEMAWTTDCKPSATEHGIFTSGDLHGISPFIDLQRPDRHSLFKAYAGSKTPDQIWFSQVSAIEKTTVTSLTALLETTSPSAKSWALDPRTTFHALDQGYSSDEAKNADLTPCFIVREALAMAALSFFLPTPLLSVEEATFSYDLWLDPAPLFFSNLLFCGHLKGFKTRRYQALRRSKSYGKGASYRYFPYTTPTSF